MKPITIWKRFNDVTRRFEHNHVEDGYAPSEQRVPAGKFEHQTRDWANGLWVKFYAHIENGRIVGGR